MEVHCVGSHSARLSSNTRPLLNPICVAKLTFTLLEKVAIIGTGCPLFIIPVKKRKISPTQKPDR